MLWSVIFQIISHWIHLTWVFLSVLFLINEFSMDTFYVEHSHFTCVHSVIMAETTVAVCNIGTDSLSLCHHAIDNLFFFILSLFRIVFVLSQEHHPQINHSANFPKHFTRNTLCHQNSFMIAGHNIHNRCHFQHE